MFLLEKFGASCSQNTKFSEFLFSQRYLKQDEILCKSRLIFDEYGGVDWLLFVLDFKNFRQWMLEKAEIFLKHFLYPIFFRSVGCCYENYHRNASKSLKLAFIVDNKTDNFADAWPNSD